jgi:hypothetical protein
MAAPKKGTRFNDLSLNGTDGNDKLQGKDGNDFLKGGGGNDDIDGGQGIDTAVYLGNFEDYTLTFKGTGNDKLTITDNVATGPGGNEGTDNLKQVEFLKFADSLFNVQGGDLYRVNATLDMHAQNPAAPGTLFAGNGIPATGFGTVTDVATGVELGLQVIYRQGPVVTTTDDYADGVLRFGVHDGPQSTGNGSFQNSANHAAWSFQYSVATGLNGDGTDLNDFTFRLLVDVDKSLGTNYLTFQLEPEAPPGAGSGTPQSNFVWRSVDNPAVVVPFDDEGNANVTQNSRNYTFAEYQAFLSSVYGPGNAFAGPAHFDIILQAFSGTTKIAENHIAVDVIL